MNYVKSSLFIILYLALTLVAGFSGLFKLPFERFFYPWDSFGMFSSYPRYHYEVIARGTVNNGTEVLLPMQEYFPMRHVFIERGEGFGVSAIIGGLRGEGKQHATARLCAYLFGRYNKQNTASSLRLRTLAIKSLSWPLEQGSSAAGEELLTRCP